MNYTHLNMLINHYEEEKNKLLQMIQTYISEENYLDADAPSKELSFVKQKPEIFYMLNDDRYDEKIMIERKEFLDKMSETKGWHVTNFMQEHQLAIEKKELEELEALNKFTNFNKADKNESVPALLELLISKKIKNLDLVLDKNESFRFEFRLKRNILTVTIPQIRRLKNAFWFGEYTFKHFLNLGFVLFDKPGRIQISYSIESPEDLAPVKFLLSKITFEIFNHNRFKNKSYATYDYTKRQ